MFYDLNIPYSPNDPNISNTLLFLSELGYTTVALSQSFSAKVPVNQRPPPFPPNTPKSLTLLSRLNVISSDPAQNQRLSNLTQTYSLIAIRPTTEKALAQACNSVDCDIISLDLSSRLPFHFKFKILSAAIARGVKFEICYGPGVTGSGLDARRQLISNAIALIRATRGRGIIISSEARQVLGVRAPWDVVNLACLWGMSQETGKDALCEEARKLVALATMKRTSWGGTIDVIHGGEKEDTAAGTATGEAEKDGGNSTPKLGNGVKRKASEGENLAIPEQPLSKREMKRRAKKARLEQSSNDVSGTSSPKTKK